MAQHAPDADLRVVRTPVGSRDGYECTIDLLRARDRPTAVFAATDDLAFDALRALTDLGLDAHDVSVVGYDNTPLAAHPRLSLTSVDQAGEELGDQAVRLLIERLEGRTRPKHRMTKPKLFARGSTTTPTPEALADAQPAPTTR